MAATIIKNHSEIMEKYISQFETHENALNGQTGHPLHEIRRAAIDHLQQLGFPGRKNEDWKYTNVSGLLEMEFSEAAPAEVEKSRIEAWRYPDLDVHSLVFVNGIYSRELSSLQDLPEGVVIDELASVLTVPKWKNLAEKYLSQAATLENNPFAVLNTALARHGIFIYVPAGVVVDKPIHLVYVTQPEDGRPVAIHPQSLIYAGANSQATILESYHAVADTGGAYWNNVSNQIVVQPGAHVRHYKLQNESEQGFQINNTRVYQERDSVYSSFAADFGGQLVRNNLVAILQAPGTETHLYGLYLAGGRQHIDNQTFIDHAHPHCNSNELYKGILTGRAKGVFNGKVLVRQDAQKTNAFQENGNLLLSDTAKMNTKPQLEIFADDVKCSHGATIGQLEEEAVFYLRSRGLTQAEARRLLTHAFLKEVVEFVELKSFRDRIEEMVSEKLDSSGAI